MQSAWHDFLCYLRPRLGEEGEILCLDQKGRVQARGSCLEIFRIRIQFLAL